MDRNECVSQKTNVLKQNRNKVRETYQQHCEYKKIKKVRFLTVFAIHCFNYNQNKFNNTDFLFEGKI